MKTNNHTLLTMIISIGLTLLFFIVRERELERDRMIEYSIAKAKRFINFSAMVDATEFFNKNEIFFYKKPNDYSLDNLDPKYGSYFNFEDDDKINYKNFELKECPYVFINIGNLGLDYYFLIEYINNFNDWMNTKVKNESSDKKIGKEEEKLLKLLP